MRTSYRNGLEILFNCIIGVFLSVTATEIFMSGLAFRISWLQVAAVSLVVVGLCGALAYSRILRRIFLILLGIAVLVSVLFFYLKWETLRNYVLPADTGGFLLACGLAALIAALSYLFASINSLFYIVCAGLAAGITVLELVGYEIPAVSLAGLLSLLLFVFCKKRYGLFYKQLGPGYQRTISVPSKRILTLLWLPVLLFFLLFGASSIKQPLLGSYGEKILTAIEEFVEKYADGKLPENFSIDLKGAPFSLSRIGFGSADRLGGDVADSKRHVLTVRSPYSEVYIGGAAYDSYDGSRWYSAGRNQKARIMPSDGVCVPRPAEYERDIGSASTISPQLQYTLLEERSITIIHESVFRTNQLFTPAMAGRIDITNLSDSGGTESLSMDADEKFTFASDIAGGRGYQLSFYHVDLKNRYIQQVLNRSRRGYYRNLRESDILYATIHTTGQYGSFDSIRTALEHRADDFYSRYLQLPLDLPARIYNLAYEITEGMASDYEKAEAIARYLSRHCSYTLTPGEVPENRDFVDYFLFDKPEGYCVYYATAMTVLLRCVGVPARYVEGFLVNAQDRTAERDVYAVTTESAHAWPEVYFEGLGFIVFEPTTSYSQQPVTTPPAATASPAGSTSVTTEPATATPSVSVTPAVTPDTSPTAAASGQTPAARSPVPTPSDAAKPTASPAGGEESAFSIKTLIMILAILTAACLLIWLTTDYSRFKRRVLRLPADRGLRLAFSRFERALGIFYAKREETQTFTEYFDALKARGVFVNEEALNTCAEIMNLYYEIRFTGRAAERQDCVRMLRLYDRWTQLMKRQCGKIRFFAERYLFGDL